MLRLILHYAGLIALLLLIGVLCTICWFLYPRWKYRHLPCPERQRRKLFYGAVKEIQENAKNGGYFGDLLLQWSKEVGTVFVIFIYNNPIVYCLEPSFVKTLVIDGKGTRNEKFYKDFHTLFGTRYLGNGLLVELNEQRWSVKRKLLNPAFKKGSLEVKMPQCKKSVDDSISYLTPMADGKTEIQMADVLAKVALDIIAKVAFGMDDLSVTSKDLTTVQNGVAQAASGAMHRFVNAFSWPMFDLRSSTRSCMEKTVNAIELVRGAGEKIFLKRIEDIKAGNDYPNDVLTHILQISNNLKDSEFGLRGMVDEFFTFLFAGSDSTAQLLAFTFEFVGRNAGVYKKLQSEVDDTFGPGGDVTYEGTNKLDYMSLVFKEVLRLAPPVMGVRRTTLEDIVVNGYKIPAGSPVSLSHYVLSKDDRFWTNPEEFNPERFRDEGERHRYTYFPFSLGARSCIGKNFAMLEAKIVMARLLQTFDFQLVPGVKLQYKEDLVLKTKNRTPLYLTIRNAS